jgi:hypothetical protein
MKFLRLPNPKLELKRLFHRGFVDTRNVAPPHATWRATARHQRMAPL